MDHGGSAVVIDLSDSPQNDLGRHAVWNEADILTDDADVAGIDLPCNTWSRARRAPPWSRMPKPLRKEGMRIYGLPELSFPDQERVNKANVMLIRAVKTIRRSLKRGGKGYLENPLLSLIWTTPEIQRLLKDPRVHFIKLDMCQYNCAWKKPRWLTGLWSFAKMFFALRW